MASLKNNLETRLRLQIKLQNSLQPGQSILFLRKQQRKREIQETLQYIPKIETLHQNKEKIHLLVKKAPNHWKKFIRKLVQKNHPFRGLKMFIRDAKKQIEKSSTSEFKILLIIMKCLKCNWSLKINKEFWCVILVQSSALLTADSQTKTLFSLLKIKIRHSIMSNLVNFQWLWKLWNLKLNSKKLKFRCC